MPYYIAKVSAKWLKENTVIFSFDSDLHDKKYSDQELTKASRLGQQDETSEAEVPLKQVQAYFTILFFMKSAPISFPIGYRVYKDNLSYLKLSFNHPFSMRLGAYGEGNRQFKTPLELKPGDDNYVEQVDIDGQETVTLHLLTVPSVSDDGVFISTEGAFFNNSTQVNNFKFENLRDYFGSPIFREHKIHVCISEVGQNNFVIEKNKLKQRFDRYLAEHEQIMKELERIEQQPLAMHVTLLQQLLAGTRVSQQEKDALRDSRIPNQLRTSIENFAGRLGGIINHYQDILNTSITYTFESLSDTQSIAPDNSRWQIIVFPAGISMTLIENHFKQTLMYSRMLIEQADQEKAIPRILSLPNPVFEIFLKEIQTINFRSTQITYEVMGDKCIVKISDSNLANIIYANLSKTREALQNYKPNQLPLPKKELPTERELPKDGFFSNFKAIVSRKNEEANPESTSLLNKKA